MIARHIIEDGFLSDQQTSALLSFALSQQQAFMRPDLVGAERATQQDHVAGTFHINSCETAEFDAFRDKMKRQFADFCAGTGVAIFDVAHFELAMAVHRDGGFFKRHIDTFSQQNRGQSDRMISAVYYFHRVPKRFSGGQLSLQSTGSEEEVLIEPVHNRLVVFPSFSPHEVFPIRIPGDRFEDARFSLVCWFHRARPMKQTSSS